MVEIVYAQEKYFNSFYDTLDAVAKERIYIEMVKAPPLNQVVKYQQDLISRNGAAYYALYGDKVVGWCDITQKDNPRIKHRGSLGMGLRPEFRCQGLGSRLITTTLDHAKSIRIEKVELQVYTSNLVAIELYKKFGFEVEGVTKNYRKLDDQYFDCLNMYKFL